MSFQGISGTNYLLFNLITDTSGEGILIEHENQIIYLNEKIKQQLNLRKEIKLPVNKDEILPSEISAELNARLTISLPGETSEFILQTNKKNSIFHAKLQTLELSGIKYKVLKINSFPASSFTKLSSVDNQPDAFPFIMFTTDMEGNIQLCNIHFYKKLVYNANDIADGLSLYSLASPANKPLLNSLFNNFEEFSGLECIELKIRKKNGGIFPANLYFKAIIKDSCFTGLICTVLDISENKRIENKYRHNQQRLRKIIDLVPHMIFLKDIKGNILLANKACADFYQTSPKNLVYENISRFHSKKDELEKILEQDRFVIQNQMKQEVENFILTDSSENKRIFKTTKVPYQESGSNEIYSLGISVDITQQKKVETEKEEANQKYRLLVDHGNDGILILLKNKIIFANEQVSKITGKPINEIIGYPLTSYIPKDQLQITFNKYKINLINGVTDDSYGLKLKKADNSDIYVEAKISTLTFEGKKSRLVFVRDITKRRMAELQSERNRNLLEQAQKIARLGSWEWDFINKRFHYSDEIYKILDIEKESPNIKPISWLAGFIPLKERKKLYKGYLNALNSGIIYETEFPVITKKGVRKTIHAQSMIYKNQIGKPVGIIGTWIDITDRIRNEQMLKEAKLKAEESDKLKSAFLANMSHEIRTPMNAVLGFANLLKRKDIDENTRIEYLDHILQSGEGLIKIINDIIDISKIESNQLQIEKYPVRLNDLMEQLFNRYEEILLLKKINEVVLKFEHAMPDPNFTVITDPFRLQQIISNLLNNAIKFTPKGEIRFGYCIVKSKLQFFVEDQGIGIPAEKREEIFERFSKLEDPDKMNKTGTGLGLSISKSLIELLGGQIWLDTEFETGSRFCFTIPLELGKTPPQKMPVIVNYGSFSDLDLHQKTILIAEDEILNYKLLETLLKKTGASVIWAKNGMEAVQYTIDNKIDLVFMDIKMPDMNGYEATKHIKRIDPSIPVIAQTAFAFSNERSYILQSGCDMYMTKPIDHHELYKALKMYLD